jgi:glycosyltransferase involved in cell wall biosynthesis
MFNWAGMFIRMFRYHSRAMEIRKSDFPFDLLIYNNAIVGLRSALSFRPVFGCINDNNNSSASWRSAILKFKWRKSHVFFLTEYAACRWMDKIIVNSDFMVREMRNRYSCSEHKLFKLYKSVEINPPFEKKNYNRIPVILFVKNDYMRGGLPVLIRALVKMNRPVRLVIAGTPPFAEDSIRHMFAGTNISYELTGIVPQDAIYKLMASADVFCVPSLKEALGVANIEAMRMGLPVVSSRTGGIIEALDKGACGWLCEPDNADSLAEALTECLANDALREEKRDYAYRFSQNFSTDRMFALFSDLIA